MLEKVTGKKYKTTMLAIDMPISHPTVAQITQNKRVLSQLAFRLATPDEVDG